MRRSQLVTVVVLVACAACAACGGGDGADAEEPRVPPAVASSTGPDAGERATVRMSVSFDGAEDDASATALGRNGGSVELVPGAPGRGRAAAFPSRCDDGSGCPRALVEIAPDPALAPGTRPFAFGASVWLAEDQTTTGSNIVQQGRFGSPDGQWKLQVDDDAGRPSCVVRTAAGETTVRSAVSVADGRWHRVVCRRDADTLVIEVDGTARRAPAVTGAVGGSAPIRVGSPGLGDGDDQFHGRLDDVFLEVYPEAVAGVVPEAAAED